MPPPRALVDRIAAAIAATLADPPPALVRAAEQDGARAHAELLARELRRLAADLPGHVLHDMSLYTSESPARSDRSGGALELLGEVYAALAGHRVVRLDARAVRLPAPHGRALWLPLADLLAVPEATRVHHLCGLGLAREPARRLVRELLGAADEPAAFAALTRARGAPPAHRPAGDLVLQPCPERRRAGAHYTPRPLAELVVRAALRPVLAVLGPTPCADALLRLQICDPAMGCGVFLLAVARQLADHLVAAWARAGDLPPDPVARARRLVVDRCVFGVDADPLAVELARRSLWLLVGTGEPPTGFLARALCHGDALVGLNLAQLRACDWRPGPPHPQIAAAVDRDPDLARDLGDRLIDAFLAHKTARDRDRARRRVLASFEAWLSHGGPPPDPPQRPHSHAPPLHWPLALPTAFDVFVGNPPFLGGSQISGAFGDAYLAWLRVLHPGAHGNADLCAHFLRRADTLLAASGTIGFITTNTIGQGDTRTTGLQALLADRGYVLHEATRDLPWPEAAAVTVAVVHLARGAAAAAAGPHLLHEPACHARNLSPGTSLPPAPNRRARTTRIVDAISSHLRPGRERPDPRPLADNRQIAFAGSKIYGQGFLLTDRERLSLIARDPGNAALICPYLGGDDIARGGGPRRFVINFGQRSLAEAEAYPELLALVRARVKPERDRNSRALRRAAWWRFGEVAPGLYAALAGTNRCVVNSQVGKHLMFDLAPTHYVYSHTVYVYATPAPATLFAILQSSIHELWARRLASSMKTDLRYSIADCFKTFPFPPPGPRADDPILAPLAERVLAARAAAAPSTLTSLYNRLQGRECTDPAIVALRARHRDLDRAVLHAYGWHDLTPPDLTDTARAEQFTDEVFARLLAANAARS